MASTKIAEIAKYMKLIAEYVNLPTDTTLPFVATQEEMKVDIDFLDTLMKMRLAKYKERMIRKG